MVQIPEILKYETGRRPCNGNPKASKVAACGIPGGILLILGYKEYRLP